MRKTYPSDVSREQFEGVKDLLEGARKKRRPREVDLYDIFCSVLYQRAMKCPWRKLPSDFPKWMAVYPYYQIWTAKKVGAKGKKAPSLLEEVLKIIDWEGSDEEWSVSELEILESLRTFEISL